MGTRLDIKLTLINQLLDLQSTAQSFASPLMYRAKIQKVFTWRNWPIRLRVVLKISFPEPDMNKIVKATHNLIGQFLHVHTSIFWTLALYQQNCKAGTVSCRMSLPQYGHGNKTGGQGLSWLYISNRALHARLPRHSRYWGRNAMALVALPYSDSSHRLWSSLK